MVTKSKLKMALVAEKDVDFKKLNLKKKEKAARKKKAQKGGDKPESNGKVEEDWEDVERGVEDSGSDEDEEGTEAAPMQVGYTICAL